MPLAKEQWTRPTRLMHLRIDEIAASDPERVWATFPKSPGDFKEWTNITFAQFARAIDRVAWLFEEKLGRSQNCEAIAYLGLPDVRYTIVSMAAAKTGYAAMFSSHTNSLEGHLSLFNACNCKHIMTSEGMDIKDIQAKRSMQHLECPSLEQLLSPQPVNKYVYSKDPINAVDDTWLILHTSGSTGLPKPIFINHGYSAAFEKVLSLQKGELPTPKGSRQSYGQDLQGRMLVPFAPFHAICSHFVLSLTVWHDITYVIARTDQLPSTSDVVEILKHGSIDSMFAAPYQLEAFAQSDDALEAVSKVRVVYYGGGSVPEHVGNKISKLTTLKNGFGATEIGPAVQIDTDTEDWAYMGLDETLMNIEWRPVPDGDRTLFEPVLLHSADPAIEQFQFVYALYPDKTEWPIGDLYEPHPTRPHLVKYAGRADDRISFAHGIYFIPLGFEHAATEHPSVRAALLAGDGHLQPICVVELADGVRHDDEAALDAVRDHIVSVSKRFPSVARVEKSHILFQPAGRAFELTPKGTVKRRASLAAAADDLEAIWRTHGDRAHDMMGGRA